MLQKDLFSEVYTSTVFFHNQIILVCFPLLFIRNKKKARWWGKSIHNIQISKHFKPASSPKLFCCWFLLVYGHWHPSKSALSLPARRFLHHHNGIVTRRNKRALLLLIYQNPKWNKNWQEAIKIFQKAFRTKESRNISYDTKNGFNRL